ncbi:hypothetical protein HOY80DRAFT_1016378 [Tuber brumale]|nr:hypothetical protein HOY80DRAFT_1016378 [Tuber brumale]
MMENAHDRSLIPGSRLRNHCLFQSRRGDGYSGNGPCGRNDHLDEIDCSCQMGAGDEERFADFRFRVSTSRGKEKKSKSGQAKMLDMPDSGDSEKEAVNGKDDTQEEGPEFSDACASRECGSGYADHEELVAKFSAIHGNEANEGKTPNEYNFTIYSTSDKLTAEDLTPTSDHQLSQRHDLVPAQGNLSVQLARRQQDRLDGAAAYDKSSGARGRKSLYVQLPEIPNLPTLKAENTSTRSGEGPEYTTELPLGQELSFREEIKGKRTTNTKAKPHQRIQKREALAFECGSIHSEEDFGAVVMAKRSEDLGMTISVKAVLREDEEYLEKEDNGNNKSMMMNLRFMKNTEAAGERANKAEVEGDDMSEKKVSDIARMMPRAGRKNAAAQKAKSNKADAGEDGKVCPDEAPYDRSISLPGVSPLQSPNQKAKASEKGSTSSRPIPEREDDPRAQHLACSRLHVQPRWTQNARFGSWVNSQLSNDRKQSRNGRDGPVPDIEIDVNAILKLGPNKRKAGGDRDRGGGEEDADDQRALNLVPTKGRKGMNVDQRGLAEKRKINEERQPVIVSCIPGWGSWTGTLNIIYQASAHPIPCQSQQHYKRSLFEHYTTARVLVKQGTVIEPLSAPVKEYRYLILCRDFQYSQFSHIYNIECDVQQFVPATFEVRGILCPVKGVRVGLPHA